ncbi:hypothetical protein LTR94_034342, partial [Friedmanniomyces endolithicus]
MTFWVAGYRNVTCAWGASGLTDEIVDAMVAHGIKRVLIAYDRDAAGDKGAGAAAQTLAARGIAVYRVMFPKGMDANAYALSVTPARKSLGALLRAAEWMAGAEGRPRMVIASDDAEPLPPAATVPLLAAKGKTEPPAAT